MRVVAIVQARMGSTRLPGKVLADLGGEPLVGRVMERLGRSRQLDGIALATSTETRDDALAELAEHAGWACTRGSEHDVLDRYHQAAREHGADVVVRVTSDCPLVDPEVVDAIVEPLRESRELDYSSNVHPRRTFPRGLDVEAFTIALLGRAWREAREPALREHVTTWMIRQPSGALAFHNVTTAEDHSDERWTVDTPEDLALVRRIYDAFDGRPPGWREVLTILDRHPEWRDLNRHVIQKTVS